MESESDDDNFDDWSDQDDVSCRSLFDTSGGMVFDSPKACLAHDMREFSFDVREICSTVGRDDITLIKLVNFVRGRVVEAQADNIPVTPDFGAALQDELIVSHSSLLRDDTLMLPVDREDPLLYLLSDELNDDDDEGSVDLVENNELSDKATLNDDSKEVERLKDQLAKTKALLKHIAAGAIPTPEKWDVLLVEQECKATDRSVVQEVLTANVQVTNLLAEEKAIQAEIEFQDEMRQEEVESKTDDKGVEVGQKF